MTKITLPDGKIAEFPDDASPADIRDALARSFTPKETKPGETLKRSNGATIQFNTQIGHYVVKDHRNLARGFRKSFPAAVELADSLPVPQRPRQTQKPTPAPEPERPMSASHWDEQVERLIRRDNATRRKEQNAKREKRRFTNRGTVRY